MEHDDKRDREARRPYEPPRIDEEFPIECVAQGCTGKTKACENPKKGGVMYSIS